MVNYIVIGDLGGTSCRLELLDLADFAATEEGTAPPPRPEAIQRSK
jgi:hypothetical protein